MTKRNIGYRWRLREVMAAHGMFSTTELIPPLADRGITLSASQVHRLVTGTPERLSLPVLSALCKFLAWLADRGRQLGHATQPDIDAWYVARPQPEALRGFWAWAMASRRMPRLDIPWRRQTRPHRSSAGRA